jgi:hypothetical protein
MDTGQCFLLLATQAYFTLIPLRSTPSLFLGCRAPFSAARSQLGQLHLLCAYWLVAGTLEWTFAMQRYPVLQRLFGGMPSILAVTAATWPPLSSLTASSLNSSVYRARRIDSLISLS